MPLRYFNTTFRRGVNLRDDATAIDDDEVPETKNLFPNKVGILETRPAMSFERPVMRYTTTGLSTQSIVGDGQHLIDLGGVAGTAPFIPFDFEFMRFGSAELVMLFINQTSNHMYLGVYPESQAYASTETDLGLLTERPQMLTWYDQIYVFTGLANYQVFKDTSRNTGFNVKAFTFSNPEDVAHFPRLAAAVRDRFWYGNFGGNQKNLVFWSEPNQPDVLTGSGDHFNLVNGFNVALPTGEAITAMKEISTVPAALPAQSSLFVWTRNETFQFQGDPASNAEMAAGQLPAGDLQVVKLNTVAGCVSPSTIVQTPHGTLWAGEDDVWLMQYGSLPVRVGTKIGAALKNTPPALRWKWHASFADGVYRLAVFAPGQGPTHLSPCQHHWWLDLRKGPPQGAEDAVWWGPQEYVPTLSGGQGTYCMKTDPRPGFDNRTYGLQSYAIQAPAGSGGLAMTGTCIAAIDSFTSRDTVAPQGVYADWQANKAYYIGDLIIPSTPIQASPPRFQVWRAVRNFTSGGSIPDFLSTSIVQEGGINSWVVLAQVPGNSIAQTNTFEPACQQTGNEIIHNIISKEWLLDGAQDKLQDATEISYFTDKAMRALMYHSPSYALTRHTLEPGDPPNPAPGYSNTTTLGMKTLGFQHINRAWTTSLLDPDPSDRIIQPSMQWRFTGLPAIYISDANSQVVVRTYNGSTYRYYVITIPSGWYANMTAFIAAWNTACELVMGGGQGVTAQVTASGTIIFTNSAGGLPVYFPVTYPVAAGTNSSAVTQQMTYATAAFKALVGMTENEAGSQDIAADSDLKISTPVYPTLNARIAISLMKTRWRPFGRRPV